MNIDRESKRWVEARIIDDDQRRRIVALYRGEEGGYSLAVLAILWIGGALVFLGVAFLLGILWDDLGAARGLIVGALDACFFVGGALILRDRPALEKTGMALLVIGGLLLLPALGIMYEDLFGSTGHLLPLVLVCASTYGVLAWGLRSRAFCCLFAAGLFLVGEEVVRDSAFNALFPLVQLGVVSRLEDMFPVVFLTLGAALALLAYLAGQRRDFAHLRTTLLLCALLVALLPAIVGGLIPPHKGLKLFLAVSGSLGGMALAVGLQESRAFWVSGVCFIGALLVVFGDAFDNSVAFTLFAIVVGFLTMGAGTYLGTQKGTWFEKLFPNQPD